MSRYIDVGGVVRGLLRLSPSSVLLKENSGSLSIRDNGDTSDAGILAFRPALQITASRNLAATDNSRHLYSTSTTAYTLTIVAGTFSLGQEFEIAQLGTGVVTLTAGAGVTLNGVVASSKSLAQYQAAFVKCYGSDVFVCYYGT